VFVLHLAAAAAAAALKNVSHMAHNHMFQQRESIPCAPRVHSDRSKI
jgi:hypothetical protein